MNSVGFILGTRHRIGQQDCNHTLLLECRSYWTQLNLLLSKRSIRLGCVGLYKQNCGCKVIQIKKIGLKYLILHCLSIYSVWILCMDVIILIWHFKMERSAPPSLSSKRANYIYVKVAAKLSKTKLWGAAALRWTNNVFFPMSPP